MEETKLYSMASANFLLGCLLNNPQILLDGKHNLNGGEDGDFAPYKFHRILFWCIRCLLKKGVTEIDEIVIDTFLQGNVEFLQICNDVNFLEVIPNLKKISLSGTLEYHYTIVKKFSLLRYYKVHNFNINEFFNVGKDFDTQIKKMNDYDIKDIIDYYENTNIMARKTFTNNTKIQEYKAGDSFLETAEDIKKGGLLGDSFQSPYTNLIFNGIYGFLLRSGASGDGKTVASVGDLLNVSCKKYWDEEKKEFVLNKSFSGASLMINTELDLKKELDPMLIGWISNIDRSKIRKWELTKEEEERVLKAREILISSPVYLVDDPEFTVQSLTNTITDYSYNKDIKNVFFDYINTNGYIDAELARESNIPQRQDMILQTATDRLKNLQRNLGISLLSGTQLNSESQKQNGHPNETWLAGGVSQIRKTDGAMIMCLPTMKELEAYDLYKEKQNGFNKILEPNRVTHIIKGRNSEFEKYIKIFSYLDTGTCRNTDLLLLDKNNEPVKDYQGRVVKKGLVIEHL